MSVLFDLKRISRPRPGSDHEKQPTEHRAGVRLLYWLFSTFFPIVIRSCVIILVRLVRPKKWAGRESEKQPAQPHSESMTEESRIYYTTNLNSYVKKNSRIFLISFFGADATSAASSSMRVVRPGNTASSAANRFPAVTPAWSVS